ncbi:MAG: hypothetical protein RIQ79_1911 [Verrucomicrobiota bacterium]
MSLPSSPRPPVSHWSLGIRHWSFPKVIAPLALGLALGATAAWFVPHPSASGQSAAHSAPPAVPTAPFALPSWSWRESATPPTLAADSASSAIVAWHALRAPDGRPADFATRADALRALLLRLPLTSFPRFLAPLVGAKLSEDDRSLRQIAFSTWIESDPSSAATWALASGPDQQDLARQAVSTWSSRDPRAAAVWACALPDQETARRFAALTLPALAALDSTQALALASARGDAFLDQLLPDLLTTLAKTDPATALRTYGPRVWKNGGGFWRLRQPLGEWAARDPAAAIAWIVAQPSKDRGEMGQWLGELAQNNAQRNLVATALATQPGVPNRQSALGNMLSRWANQDPVEALAWLDTLSDRNLRIAILERSANITYSDHPERTLPLALAMPEGANRSDRLGQLLSQWATKDAPAALAWLRDNASAPGVAAASDSVRSTLLATIARDEPATAVAEWQALPEGPLKTKAISTITAAWGQTDPAAALQWSTAQSKNDYPSSELVYTWARKDGPAALQWAESISEPNIRSYALNALAGNWQDKAPRAATADLYAQIKDPAVRTQFVTQHVQEWQTRDPAAAKSWLAAHPDLGIKN